VRLAIGGVIHRRWTLDAYLQAMAALEKPPDHVMAWVVDDADGLSSASIMAREGQKRAIVNVVCLPGIEYRRQSAGLREKVSMYTRLACLRNILAEVALGQECDALLSVDSDIIVPPDLLTRLLSTRKPWVAGLVRNSQDGRYWNVMRLRNIESDAGLTDHFLPVGVNAHGETWPGPEGAGWDPRDPAREQCLMAGAACLYSRDLLERARWRTDGRGRQEDVGFAIQAFRAGFRAWYVPVICQHLTVEGTTC